MPATADRELRTLTLESFADTVLPGEKRGPGDRAIAGAASGGGAVQAGAVAVLETAEGGMEPALDEVSASLNRHANAYRARLGLDQDEEAAFSGLSFEHRTALIGELVAPQHPERALWVGIAMFCFMAFDTGAHLHTVEAMAAGHPGLATLGFAPPGPDGLWRFPAFSYGRQLAEIHPGTDSTGSPS